MILEDLLKQCEGLDDTAISAKVREVLAPLSFEDKLAQTVELAKHLERHLIQWGKQMEASAI